MIVLKRDAVAKVVLNNLYKHTQLQENFGANMLAIVPSYSGMRPKIVPPAVATQQDFLMQWTARPRRRRPDQPVRHRNRPD